MLYWVSLCKVAFIEFFIHEFLLSLYYKLNENQFKIEALFFIFLETTPFLQTFFSNTCVLKKKKKHFYSRINYTYMYCFQILNNNNNYSVLLNFNLDFEGNRVPLYIWQQQCFLHIYFFKLSFFIYLIFYLIIYWSNYLSFKYVSILQKAVSFFISKYSSI